MKTKILVCILAFVMIFAIGAMTACGSQGEKGETGAAGAPGANGADGADGVGIADVKIEDGKLVIVYTDDSKTELALPTAGEAAACDHENVTYGELVNAPHTYDAKTGKFTDGKYVAVCSDCGNAEIVEGVIHTYSNVAVEAKCLAEAYTVDTCLCGYENASSKIVTGPAKGHSYEFSYAVYSNDVGKSVCVDGGVVFEICKDCNDTKTNFYSKGIGHNVTALTVTTVPGDDHTGVASGVCSQCLGRVSVELPVITNAAYNADKVLTNIVCNERAGKGTYTTYINTKLEKDSLTNTKADGLVEIKFNIDLGKVEHMLNGEFVTDGAVVPFGTKGVTELTNMPSSCAGEGTLGTGVFTCEVCGKSVGVSTEKTHTYVNIKPIEGMAATCYATGMGKADCSVCGAKDVDYIYEKLPHNFTGSLVGTTLNIICVNPGCSGEGNQVIYDVSDVKETASTCLVGGTITYSYMQNGVKKTGVVNKATSYHKLLGVEIDLNVPVYVGTAGVTDLNNSPATCTTNGQGTFVCSDCNKPFGIFTKVDHSYDATGATVVEATCQNEGSITLAAGKTCSGCGESVFTTPKLDHKEGYKTVLIDDVLMLQAGCVNKGCTSFESVNYEIAEDGYVIVLEATCTTKGKANVTYIYDEENNVNKTVTVDVDEKYHTLNGKDMDLNGTFYASEHPGIVVLQNAPVATCSTLGSGFFTCDVCKGQFGVSLTAKHTISNPETVAPTCENRGYTHGLCAGCNEMQYNYVPALGHKYVVSVDNFVLTLTCSTCKALNEDSNSENNCDCTGVTTIDLEIDSLAKLKNTKIITRPTCDVNGETYYLYEVEIRDYAADKYDDNNVLTAAGKKTIEVEYTHIGETVDHAPAGDINSDLDYIVSWHETYVDDKDTEDTEDDVTYVYDCVGFVCASCGHTIVVDFELCGATAEDADPEDCVLVYLENLKNKVEEEGND